MIQITPQMRIWVAVEPVDFRKGIDGLAGICRQQLQTDPMDGALFVFRSRNGQALNQGDVGVSAGAQFPGATPGPMKDLAALLLPAEQRSRFLEEIKASLTPAQFETVRAVFDGAAEVLGIVEVKNTSISRLCAQIFGPRTEKGRRLCGGTPKEAQPGKRRPGHGRTSHREYTGARRIQVPHPHLKAEDRCRDCDR